MATKKRAFISFDIDHDEGAKKNACWSSQTA